MRRISIAALVLALLVVVGGPPTPTRAAVSATAAESAVIGLINNARTARGLRPLVPWTALASVAGYRAARMASLNVLSHTRPGSLSASSEPGGSPGHATARRSATRRAAGRLRPRRPSSDRGSAARRTGTC